MGFHHVPQVLNVFLNMFPLAPHFVSYLLLNVVLLEPIEVDKYWDTLCFYVLSEYFLQSFNTSFFVKSQSKRLIGKNK
jgi:hypothetical protein